MKKTVLMLGGFMMLQASARAQFSGTFAPANWTYVGMRGTTSVDTGNAPTSLQFNASGDVNGYSVSLYYMTAPATGTLSFNWSVVDPSASGLMVFDLNGSTDIFYSGGATSGTYSRAVNAGDQIEFDTYQWNTNPAISMTGTIANFSAPGSSPLPIKLKSFSGVASAGGNRLDWETALESDISTFSIERGADGKAYKAVGMVAARNTPGKYKFTDSKFDGTAYYRLRVNNIDGTADYSNVISLHQTESELSLSAYPNPATDNVTVRTNTAGSGATISLMDMTGRILDMQRISNNTASFDLKAQPAGIYVIRFNDGAQVQTMRIVKQ